MSTKKKLEALRNQRKKRKRKEYKFRSSLEDKFSKWLTYREIPFTYESELVKYEVHQFRNYKPDFILKKKDGSLMMIELKGWLKNTDRIKYEMVLSSNPDLDLRFVFQKNNPIYTGSKTMYSDWAKKVGRPYCIGLDLPISWLEELEV